jgi:phosphoglycolate phosphatase
VNANAGPPARWIAADAYLFDIDGTLLNAYGGAHYNAFHSALETCLGLTCKIDGVPLHGNTDRGILRAVSRREGLPDAQLDERMTAVLAHMCAEVERNRHMIRAELCPGISALLEHLRNAGKLLGVASGNLAAIGWLKLEAAGLRDYFSFGAFSDHHELRTEIFGNAVTEVRSKLGHDARVCVVGDTPFDVKAAKEVGIPVIAVATGIYTCEQLQQDSPDICVATCEELLESALSSTH